MKEETRFSLADAAVILGIHYTTVNDRSKLCPNCRSKDKNISDRGFAVDLDVFVPWLQKN